MMKLSTMIKVFNTVDGEWRSPLAERILENWGYDEGSVYYLRASANFIFLFKKNDKYYFLRFNDSCERELQTIEAEVNILLQLGEESLHVAQPVPSLNDRNVEVVETELGTFYAVVFEALQGEHVDIEELTEEQTYLWGKSLGQLHESFKRLDAKYAVARPSWQDHLLKVKDILPPHETAALLEYDRILKWIKGLPVTKENFGLIHYDFELDNVVFDNKSLRMLDFDDCASYWYVADLVNALRDAGEFNTESPVIKRFLEGHQTETTVDTDILKEAHEFMNLHKLVTFAKLLRSVDIEDSEEYPEWLNNLRNKFCRLIDEYRLSFEKNLK